MGMELAHTGLSEVLLLLVEEVLWLELEDWGLV